nr:MAG TPA: hypothetical protein [Caudoviricetes sp.]
MYYNTYFHPCQLFILFLIQKDRELAHPFVILNTDSIPS